MEIGSGLLGRPRSAYDLFQGLVGKIGASCKQEGASGYERAVSLYLVVVVEK